MKNAIRSAAEHTTIIDKNDFEVMLRGIKSMLFNPNQPWVKRDGDTFALTMGAYGSAKICALEK